MDTNWLMKKLSSQKISRMPVPLKIKGISALKHKSKSFALTIIYILGIDKKGHKVYISISCELYLVNRLKANMLVGNDILCTKSFAINLSISSVLIHSYGVKIDINARQHSKFLRHRALASAFTIVPPHLEALVAFQHIKLPDSRDFLFYLSSQQHLILYFYLLNYTSTKVFVRNNADHVIKIVLYYRLNRITELPYENCFTISADLDVAFISLTLPTISPNCNDISIPIAKDLEIELLNGIKIYGDKETVDTITYLVDEHSSIWESLGFVQILPERWIKVHLKSG